MIGVDTKIKAKPLVEKCLKKGLLINSTDENTLRFLPPLIIDKKIIDDSIEIISEVINNEN